MALFPWLDPVDEDNVIRDVENNIKQQKDLGKTVTPQAAAKIGEIYRQSPWIPPAVALALAKGNASGEAVDAASRVGLRQYINENNPNKPKRNWFQRNVYDKAKAMSRWAFAGLQLAPDLTQNLASQVFNDNPQGLDGWFASTQLGTMMGNSSQAGSGFFFGGEAAKTQAQRAREFRGTVGNSAWTIGRGAADVFFTPGSKEFNLLSGLVDAAVTVYSDPTTYIGPAVKAAKTGESAKGLIGTKKATQKLADFIAEKGLVEIDRIPGLGEESLAAAQALARGEAGLNSAEGIAFSNTKFGQWIQNNTKVQRLINDWAGKSAEITRRVGAEGLTAEQAATERGFLAFEIMEQFKGRIDEATALRIAGADDVTKQMGVFGEAAARLSQSSSDVLLPGVISDVKGTGATYALRQVARERLPLYRSMRNSRLFTETAKNAVIMNGSGLDRAQALMNYANYLRGMKLHTEAPDEFRIFMGQAVNAFGEQDPATQKKSVEELFDRVIEIAFERAGGEGGKGMAQSVIAEAKAKLAEARVFTINDAGDIEDAGLVRRLGDFFPKETLAKFNPEQLNKLTLQGPGSLVELMDNVQFLPDFRRVRALTGNPMMRRVFTNKAGNQRAALAITEFVQNEVWKPLALATGGYAMRNMIDAQTRIALAGLKGFFNHPFQYIQQVLGDAAVGGITEDELGNPVKFTGKISDLINSRDQRLAAFQDAMEYSTYQGLEDPVNEFGRSLRNGNFSIEDRGSSPIAHTTGMVDNLALIADDPVLRQVVSRQNMPAGQRAEEVLDWLRTDPNGQDSARKIIKYMRGGVKLADPETGRYTIVKFTEAPEEELLRYWVDSLSEHKVNHVVRGDADLAFVVQHNRVPASVDVLDAQGNVTGRQRAPQVSLFDTNVVIKNGQPLQPGAVVDLGDDTEGIITSIRPVELGQSGEFVLKINPQLRKETGVLFHGTATPLKEGFDNPFEIYQKDAENLMGRGIYLTDEPRVAISYTSKGATKKTSVEGINASEDGVVYKTSINKNARIVDLRVRDERVVSAIRQTIDDWSEYLEYEGADLSIVENAMQNADATSEQLMAAFKDSLKGATLETADQAQYQLSEQISAFADVVSYQGGVRRGGLGKHNAFVVLNSGVLDVSGEFNPLARSFGDSRQIIEIQPVSSGKAFTADFLGSPALRDLIDEKGDLGLLPQKVKRAERGVPKNPDVAKRALTAWKRGTDFFFNGLYGRAVQKLERSIVWRQYFYKEIDQNLDLLAPQEAQRLVDNITKFAARYDMPPERYVGDKDIWKRIQATAQNPTSEAVGTLEQIEEYASAVAVYNTKELLYNASERSNLEDILRVVVPFAGAWKEVLGTYADFLIEDPTRIRRAQLAFTGATQFDPDNNGEGFFYKDPTSGEYSFNFPGSGWLSDFLTGVEMPLQAPVKRLSIGLGIIPSIGPVAQIAASKIIPDTPAFDEVVKILMPYGRKEGFPIAPTWLKRAQEVISGDTMNMETIYGNTYIETMRALSISGEYDLSDPAEKEKLMADARNKARILAGMRVLGQFIGPTSPSGEFEVSTKNGDIYATKLVQEFYKLQSENYDTAVQRFLEIYGNDALLYISSKSESLAGGMEATEEFGDWERENDGLFERYPDVAGYMAPGGTDFSFEVWNRQLRAGKRRRLTDRELIAQAEYRIGAAKYREMKAKVSANPTAEQKEWLASWKQRLYQEYPGFLTNSKFDPNAFPRKIEQMRNMVADPALADNDVAQALAQYIGYRDKALARAAQDGLKSLDSKAAEPLRDWLGSIAIALAQETPEFARIYDRELSYEVEQ